MNLKKSKNTLNLLTPNSQRNEDNLKKPSTNIILPNDICIQEAETIDNSLRRSFSDSKLFIPSKSCLTNKRPSSARERSTNRNNSLEGVERVQSKSHILNCNEEVTVLYAGPGVKQKQCKPLNVSGETNCNQQNPQVQIFFHSTFNPSEQIGQNVNSVFGRHNNLQDRYKNRPIILHFEEHRKQLKVPDKLPYRRRHYNSPVTKSHPTIPESNEDTNNGSSDHKDDPQNQNECKTIPINQIFDISTINMFHKMHISNDIIQGIIMVDFDKMNCSSSRISQIRHCSAKTNKACSPVVIRFLSQHARKTDPSFDRHFTTNKKICKRTNEIRKRFHDISLTNTTSVSSMSEKIFRKRTFRGRKTRNTSKTINEN